MRKAPPVFVSLNFIISILCKTRPIFNSLTKSLVSDAFAHFLVRFILIRFGRAGS
jgi:hypothetical protein